MRLGGITWWRNNYGSILQAYALQVYIREDLKQDYIIINQYSKKMISLSNLRDKLKNQGIRVTCKKIIWRIGLPKLRKRVRNLQLFVDENLIITKEVYSESNIVQTNKFFDGYICGSDQIWNPANNNFDSIYWLGFAEAGKIKISYAPSIGITSADSLTVDKIVHNISTFDALSTREEDGTAFLNKIQKKIICKTVVDPTLLVNKNLWDSLSQNKVEKDRYVFSYFLRGSAKERKIVEKFAKNKNLKIVTIPFLDAENIVLYDFKFGSKKLWEASPADFISAIRYADYVFTDSFHCMVFSCIYHRNFYIFPKKGKLQMSRIEGLHSLLEIESRVISKDNSILNIEKNKKINWENVDKLISLEKIKSRQFLKQALERGKDGVIK